MSSESKDTDLDLDLSGFSLSDLSLTDVDAEVAVIEEEEEEARGKPTLDELDLGAYDIIDVGFENSTEFLRKFLASSQDGFIEEGRGDFECILRWPHQRVNDEDIERFTRAVRSRVSYLRQKMPSAKRDFKVTRIGYEILPDNKHVAFHMARMTELVYANFHQTRTAPKHSPVTDELLKYL